MDDEKLKNQIGANIAAHRKRAGLTQAGLAEKLNYSDKAVSKWERGESVPDVLTLMAIAQKLGVTVNDLITDPNALPENGGKVEKTYELPEHDAKHFIRVEVHAEHEEVIAVGTPFYF